ncbi:MAG: hypothetical protein AAF497_23305 [Planctomycetota bacterium]
MTRHKDVPENFALDIAQEGFATSTGRQSDDVVCAKIVQELLAILPRHFDRRSILSNEPS